MTPRRIRLLVVEDDERRIERFRTWLPDAHLVWAPNAGAAFGIITRDFSHTETPAYQGIMLDIDLDRHEYVKTSTRRTGRDVARLVVERVSRDVSVFIHSMNPEFRGPMAKMLDTAGFSVTLVPMTELEANPQPLLGWAVELREHAFG